MYIPTYIHTCMYMHGYAYRQTDRPTYRQTDR